MAHVDTDAWNESILNVTTLLRKAHCLSYRVESQRWWIRHKPFPGSSKIMQFTDSHGDCRSDELVAQAAWFGWRHHWPTWPGHQSWFKNPLHPNFASVYRIINRIWVLTSAATVYTPLTRFREWSPKSCCLAVSIEQSFPLTGGTWPEKQWYSSHKTMAAFIKAETVICYTKYIDRRMQG